jgi:hypothetical protein
MCSSLLAAGERLTVQRINRNTSALKGGGLLAKSYLLPGAFAHVTAATSGDSFVQWRTVGALSRDIGWMFQAVL